MHKRMLIMCFGIVGVANAEPAHPLPIPTTAEFFIRTASGRINGCEVLVNAAANSESGAYVVKGSFSSNFLKGHVPGSMIKMGAYKWGGEEFIHIPISHGVVLGDGVDTSKMRQLGLAEDKKSQLYMVDFKGNERLLIELEDILRSRPYFGFTPGGGKSDLTFRIEPFEESAKEAFRQFNDCMQRALSRAKEELDTELEASRRK
jgi:hypothetical protein